MTAPSHPTSQRPPFDVYLCCADPAQALRQNEVRAELRRLCAEVHTLLREAAQEELADPRLAQTSLTQLQIFHSLAQEAISQAPGAVHAATIAEALDLWRPLEGRVESEESVEPEGCTG